jgi:hypothetical protein
MELNPLYMNVIAITATVAGLLTGGWWVVSLYWLHSRKEEKELPEVELPGQVHEAFSRVPPAMIIFLVFIGVSLVAYVLYIWLAGVRY